MDQPVEWGITEVKASHKKQWEWTVAAAVVIIVTFLVWWFVFRLEPVEVPADEVVQTTESQSLGGVLLESAQNPIKNQLPGAPQTVTNPIEGVYKNPFE